MNTLTLIITLNQETGELSVNTSADQLLYGDAIVLIELAKERIIDDLKTAMADNVSMQPIEDEQEE